MYIDIGDNEKIFCNLLKTINRENANIDSLINKLVNSDFFTAPASTKYHNSVQGGLVDHCLNVYYNLRSLVERKHFEDIISEESIVICGLLHDISKMNFYKPSIKNEKVYSEEGSKWDNLGNFDWVSKEIYTTIPLRERFMYGNHEENSEFMVRCYIPLTLEESIAILHHHGGMSYDSSRIDVGAIYGKYPLACLLHVADMMAAFIDESYE